MCGIVGYIGHKEAKEVLLKGLEKLEYRGYDSAGIALLDEGKLSLYKEKGRIASLRSIMASASDAASGIGHTRWATHGEPSRANAHPHLSPKSRFALVHNGVIENYEQLRREHLEEASFRSETDTEVIVHLLEELTSSGMTVKEAFRKTLSLLEGSYAIAMIDSNNPDTLYAAKNKSPLLVGVGDSFNSIASDAMAMIQLTDRYLELFDGEMALISRKHISIETIDGTMQTRQPFKAEIDSLDLEKGTYPHYMLKEIDEQPLVIRRILGEYQNEAGKLQVDETIRAALSQADRIHIVACGTSYHAGLVGKEFLEKFSHIPTEVHIASEFSLNPPLLSKQPLFIFISQSGETADSRGALQLVKKLGHPTLTITNVKGSTLSREADMTMLLHAGPEIAVASTKAYTAQIAVLAILSTSNGENGFDLMKELALAAQSMERLTAKKDIFEQLARTYLSESRNAFFIGRSMDYHVALEAALKLKEISYIQAEGFAGGELKHGTIALIEDGTPVITLSTQRSTDLSIRGNVQEVSARGAKVCILSCETLAQEDDAFRIPAVHPMLSSLVSIIPVQLISYYAALHRGCDVDKPKNLAKSVTI